MWYFLTAIKRFGAVHLRAILQRVREASVTIEGDVIGKIGLGWAVFLGVSTDDTIADVKYMAEKTIHLRAFPDEEGKMNKSVLEVGGAVLVVSQFTLMADCRKGRRPSFVLAAPPEKANQLYEDYVKKLSEAGLTTATGKFQSHMDVRILNDGPVTMMLDSKKLF
jgi:D-tyrosyl-tRNA(Tyr) deacylase